MTVRKTKLKSTPNTPEKTARKAIANAQRTTPQDLQGWIKFTESKFIEQETSVGGMSLTEAQEILALIRKTGRGLADQLRLSANPEETLKKDLDVPYPEDSGGLSEGLLMIWADPKFWGYLRVSEDSHEGDDFARKYLLLTYHLTIDFQASVWFEMVKKPVERDYLFNLMVWLAPNYFWVHSANPLDHFDAEMVRRLSREKMGDILHRYVQNPGQDWRPFLRQFVTKENLSADVIKRIQSAVKSLADDLSDILKHPDRREFPRAPRVPHRSRGLKRSMAIEALVCILRQDVKGPSYNIAKTKLGRISAAGRELVNEAKRLALYRDNLPVMPPRRRVNKKMPITPT